MAMPGLIEWLILIGLALLVGGTFLANRSRRRQRESRGFEVKLSTGSSPVPREKENDHG